MQRLGVIPLEIVMRNKLLPLQDKLLFRKRGTIESVENILKKSESLEHTRHRSFVGFLTHVIANLIAYNFRKKRPSILRNSKREGLIC
ncbi:hypothetical protein CVU75_00295 [Candidatus Dependentiae bacterium HGW-Dependentiae-1]|nr:MAG: hypothetical protein CVU75_00295 [Candidatus Dependentiae bacterium HGW-Dependentiae-1]